MSKVAYWWFLFGLISVNRGGGGVGEWGSGGVGEWGIERVRNQGKEEEVLWDVMGFSASSRFFFKRIGN